MTGMLAGLHDQVRLAVAALVDPVTITLPRDDGSWVHGVNVCLIDQLTDAISTTSRAGSGGRSGGHALVICVAAVDIYAAAFDDFRAPGYTLKQSVEAIPDHLIGNEDVSSLTRGLRMLEKLRKDIENLFEPPLKVGLVNACPECGVNSVAFVDDIGETVRQPALVVSPTIGAECRNCNAMWSASQLPILANLLTNQVDKA